MLHQISSMPAGSLGGSNDQADGELGGRAVVRPSSLEETAFHPVDQSHKLHDWPGRVFHRLFPGMRTKPVSSTTQQDRQPQRLLMWIDAVGGYLVCLNEEIVIGQAVPGSAIDVPVLGDISRRHAILRRSGESHLIEPLEDVFVDGQALSGPRYEMEMKSSWESVFGFDFASPIRIPVRCV